MKICLCDDNALHSSKLENIIEEYVKEKLSMELEIEIYESGNRLLTSIEMGANYQILFLDIEMDGMNGIDVAREIRKKDKSILIIYVTSYDKYTMESFEVAPFRYLLKPIDKEELQKVIHAAIHEVTLHNEFIFFKCQNRQYQVKSSDVFSITSDKGRMIIINTIQKEEYSYYGKIKDLESSLNPLIFVKINQGTIINLNEINIISGNDIYMVDGQIFQISRSQKKIVKNIYNEFLKRKIGF